MSDEHDITPEEAERIAADIHGLRHGYEDSDLASIIRRAKEQGQLDEDG